MLVRKAQPADAAAIAALHIRRLSFGLLSQLGEEFVTSFYASLMDSPLGFGVVAERDGRLLGFTMGVTDWRKFSGVFLRSHIWMAVRSLALALRHGRWRRLLETRRYATATNLPPAELISVAVEPDEEGTGLAAELARGLFAEFQARGVRTFRITTASSNARSIRFYEKLGLRPQPLEMHRGEQAVLYIVSLDSEEAPRTVRGPSLVRVNQTAHQSKVDGNGN